MQREVLQGRREKEEEREGSNMVIPGFTNFPFTSPRH